MDSLHDRFDPQRYEADEPVTVSCAGEEHDVPERLFTRVQAIGGAYELHLLPAVDIYSRTELSPAQCATLADEVAFISALVKDPLLGDHLEAIRQLAQRCLGQGAAATLVVEGP